MKQIDLGLNLSSKREFYDEVNCVVPGALAEPADGAVGPTRRTEIKNFAGSISNTFTPLLNRVSPAAVLVVVTDTRSRLARINQSLA